MKKVLATRWSASRTAAAAGAVLERQQARLSKGAGLLSIESTADLDLLVGLLRPGRLDIPSAKVLLAMLWDVVPTPHWLQQHAWETEGTCPRCGGPDDLRHLLHGCPDEAPEEHHEAEEDWKKVLAYNWLNAPRPDYGENGIELQEYVSGFRVPPGTVRFTADSPIYTDGSAKFVGTDFATCSGAVVQLGSDNVWRAVAMAVSPDRPQGAISGEVLAVQLLATVLARGTPDGEPHKEKTFSVGIDCSAVVAGLSRHVHDQHPGRFLYAGVFRCAGLQAVGSVLKIRAHVWEEDARREGWHAAWKGNDVADEYAKMARPALSLDPKPWLDDIRLRTKLAKRLLADIAAKPLWAEMKRLSLIHI